MIVRVPANPEVIRWAVERSVFADSLLENDPKVRSWVEGQQSPTWKQLRDFAEKVGTPVGFLLLDSIPRRTLPVADFREGFLTDSHENSAELHAVLNVCQRRQDWFVELVKQEGREPLSIVGSANGWSVSKAAKAIRQAMEFEVASRRGSVADQRRKLISRFEELGGLTVVNSMVNDNCHRPLDPDEFRGFSLVNEFAPLIFVNSAQTLNGQLFTFAHELAHVWHGAGGIDNATVASQSKDPIERWCNEVAGEFLVPRDDLLQRLKGKKVPSPGKDEFTEFLEVLARVYKCGTLVVLHALKRTDYIGQTAFSAIYEAERKRLMEFAQTHKSVSGGGNINFSRRYRIGEAFSHAVVKELAAGRIQPTQVLSLTGIRSMKSFDSYAEFLAEQGF